MTKQTMVIVILAFLVAGLIGFILAAHWTTQPSDKPQILKIDTPKIDAQQAQTVAMTGWGSAFSKAR